MTINHIVISGNLTKDAEVRTTSAGKQWCTFTVAVNDREKQGDEWVNKTSYFDCKWFGGLVQYNAPSMTKGTKVCVAGKMVQNEYASADGSKKRAWNVIADAVETMVPKEHAASQMSQDEIPF